jgi:sugar transferase (PEP-CTERM system associated)
MASTSRLRFSLRTAALVMMETTFIMGAVALAAVVRLGFEGAGDTVGSPDGILKTAVIAVVCQLCLYFGDLYDLRVVAERRELFIRVLQSLSATSIILAVLYFWFPVLVIGRGVFVVAAFLVITAVVGWRVAFEWVSRRIGVGERLLLIGATPAAVALAREIAERRSELGVEIVGFVDVDRPGTGVHPASEPVLIGGIDDIPRIVRDYEVDRVVVNLSDARGRLPMDKLLEIKLNEDVSFDHLATVYEQYTGKIAVENLRPSWLLFSEGFRKSRWLLAGKRSMDVLIAGVGLVIAAPIMLVAGLIKLTSPGPILYSQQRVGLQGRVFTIRKFRSMRQDAEAVTGAVWAQKNDVRITPFGRFLRRSRLDEIPQLWNALTGDMSLVGPRPERPEFVSELTKQIPFYGQRHAVKPGVTGWAQVRYTYGASVEDALQKLQYDLFYIKNMSLALDLFIIFDTVKTVVLRRGA